MKPQNYANNIGVSTTEPTVERCQGLAALSYLRLLDEHGHPPEPSATPGSGSSGESRSRETRELRADEHGLG